MSDTIGIVIADDHVLVLDGLRQALQTLPDIEVLGLATDGPEIIAVLAQITPDVLLLDIEMPGMSGLTALGRTTRPPPTIVVTMHTGDEFQRRAVAAGAVGFLSKSTPLPDLAAAIRAAADGVNLLEVEDLASALDGYREPRLTGGAAALTARERELLRLLSRGISGTDDLADEMFISRKTVKNHLANIYVKLAVSDRAQAVVEAVRLGLDRE